MLAGDEGDPDVVSWPFKLLFWLLALLLPMAGAWFGSSIAAYRNSATWVPFVAAAMAFPVVPLLWEAFGAWRFRRKRAARDAQASAVEAKTGKRFDDAPRRFLTFGDRLVLRTMVVNLLFVGGIMVRDASVVFTALAARGDWFLDRVDAPWAADARRWCFAAADRLEWLWEATHENPYVRDDEPPPPPPDLPDAPPGDDDGGEPPDDVELPDDLPELPDEGGDVDPGGDVDGGDGGEVDSGDDDPAEPQDPAPRRSKWPFAPTLHPAVASVPASVETDPASVGRYLAKQEEDPLRRLKLLHDYVADRIAYDVPALRAPRIPPQSAEKALREGKAVCSGYALLLQALGKAAGLEIVYVVGFSRDTDGSVPGVGHAWNAAKVDGQWYLIDTTWDAGHVNGETFTKKYTADYLMTPPEVFGLNHLPDEPRWQLRASPISRGEFIRQPNVRPMLYAQGFILEDPTRSQVTVSDDFTMRLQNRRGRHLMVKYGQDGRCDVTGTDQLDVVCDLPRRGTYPVKLFVGQNQYGTYWYAGRFEVHLR